MSFPVTTSLRPDGLYFRGIVVESDGPSRPRRFRPPAHPAEVRPASGPGPSTEATLFFSWLLSRLGLRFSSYRLTPLCRRLPACLRWLRVDSVEEARRRIDDRPELAAQLLNVVLLGVTAFRRDPSVFERLESVVLPALLASRGHVRIWSAACASGHELYSVAMALAGMGALHRADLLGTDVRPEAIVLARTGRFPGDSLGLEAVRRSGHFSDAGGGNVMIAPRLRSAIRWRCADLLNDIEPGPWDLILWRNMAIYLEAASVDRLWQAMERQLRPGGYLVVGRADYPPAVHGLERISSCIYRRPGA